MSCSCSLATVGVYEARTAPRSTVDSNETFALNCLSAHWKLWKEVAASALFLPWTYTHGE